MFCSRKTPIRAAKQLAEDLCHTAKSAGGLEIEVLESVEPPFDGLSGMRDRLLGENWREGADKASRLTLPRETVLETYKSLHELWIKEKFPASQAHRALRDAQDAGALSEEKADEAAEKALGDYFAGAGKEKKAVQKPLLQPLPRDRGRRQISRSTCISRCRCATM